ncbi:MAG: hypothetical protein J6S14_11360 [Clostridia bacterium]|nr:hypothetical protein [Clostridia bacterium]
MPGQDPIKHICPKCRSENVRIEVALSVYANEVTPSIRCRDCGLSLTKEFTADEKGKPIQQKIDDLCKIWDALAGNKEPKTVVEMNMFDREDLYTDCTVQVLTNTVTGEVSVGWWENNN